MIGFTIGPLGAVPAVFDMRKFASLQRHFAWHSLRVEFSKKSLLDTVVGFRLTF